MPASTSNPAQFHKDMRVGEIVALLPEAADIMTEYGMHCSSCSLGAVESLAEGCQIHGFEDEVLVELLDDLNTALKEAPAKEHMLTITPEAAKQVQNIAKAEGIKTAVLHVVVDMTGGFCLEFADTPVEGGKSFTCSEVPDVSVSASELVLNRIGGAVIDYREDRFKLDLPEDTTSSCCQGDKKQCGCS